MTKKAINKNFWDQKFHQKDVAHVVNFINTTGNVPGLKDVKDMFGFTDDQCLAILQDALVKVACQNVWK